MGHRRTTLGLLALVTLCAGLGAGAPAASGDPLTGVADVSAGTSHGCALGTDGTARCWGDNRYGALGDGTTATRIIPVVVKNESGTGSLTGITQIAAGDKWSCALLADQTARCWGWNVYGLLGDGTTHDRFLPVTVKNENGTGSLTGIVQLTTGIVDTCALLTDGTARCWGYNMSGQLGNGTNQCCIAHPLPLVVKNETGTGPLTNIVQLTAGYAFTCARLTDGTARCWGENSDGQLGDGTIAGPKLFPVVVKNETATGPLTGVGQIAASTGYGFACARLTDGTARCWGDNQFGELGVGSTVRHPRPVVVENEAGTAPLTGVVAVVVANDHSCAQRSDSTARCWGGDSYGQLGDGTFINRTLPVAVKNPSATGTLGGIARIAAGEYHTCSVMTDGSGRCWGATGSGRLGDGSLPFDDNPGAGNEPLPGTIKGVTHPLANVALIATSNRDGHTCAPLTDGTVRCWGNNSHGQLGDGTLTGRLVPVGVMNSTGAGLLAGVTQVATGANFTCARLTDGTARCWGNNGSGQLGDGTTTMRLRPVVVKNEIGTAALTGITQLSAGVNFTCARLTDGTERCWGNNGSGQLGDGTTTMRLRPVVVKSETGTAALTGITQVSAGLNFTCARRSDGTARCWGSNVNGQLGDGSNTMRLRPVVVENEAGTAALTGVTQVATGTGLPSTCARRSDGTARCWGNNANGQLGDGTTFDRWLPVVVKNAAGTAALSGVSQLTAGYGHACAQMADNSARCWGRNQWGQLGNGTTTASPLPTVVKNQTGTGSLTGVAQISAGINYTCARMSDRTARCWGSDAYFGQLGNVFVYLQWTQRLPLTVLAA